MRVLVACEESQVVCMAFRNRGHEAYSADILEPSGNHPEWHILGDVVPIINGNCSFYTMDGAQHLLVDRWDMLIAFPPCTHLAVSGAAWFSEKRKDGRQRAAIDLFFTFIHADCERIAVENPTNIISGDYLRLYYGLEPMKPTQAIQPYQFGHQARKRTCLWLKGLPCLQPTDIVDPGVILPGGYSVGASASYARDENGKIIPWNDPRTAKIRSRTYTGIAKAMADQWG